MLPGEGLEEVQSTLADVLPLEVDPSQVLWAEEEALGSMRESRGQEDAKPTPQVVSVPT